MRIEKWKMEDIDFDPLMAGVYEAVLSFLKTALPA